MMKVTQPFAEFQTQFLQLAGKGDIPDENLWFNLYNKLTSLLQDRLAAVLEDLDTYNKLARCCLTTNIELKYVSAYVDHQEQIKDKKASRQTGTSFSALFAADKPTNISATNNKLIHTSMTPEICHSATPLADILPENCFNCGKPGHYSCECTKPKCIIDLKKIEKDKEESSKLGKEEAQGKTPSQASLGLTYQRLT